MSNLDVDLDFLFEFLQKPTRVPNSRLDLWRADLAKRVWRQRVIIKRCGFAGSDWSPLLDELEEYAYVSESMAAEIAHRRAKAAA